MVTGTLDVVVEPFDYSDGEFGKIMRESLLNKAVRLTLTDQMTSIGITSGGLYILLFLYK